MAKKKTTACPLRTAKKQVAPFVIVSIEARDFAKIEADHKQACLAWLGEHLRRIREMGPYMRGPFSAGFSYQAPLTAKIARKRAI